MKRLFIAAAATLTASLFTLAYAASPSRDLTAKMEKCEVCKHMAAKPELMKNAIWETHKIDKGMLCVISVPKEYKKDFDAANAEMKKSIGKVMAAEKAGEKVELCGFCQGMGELMKAGAKQQEISTAVGGVSLVTSDDPTVIEKIHAQADKAIEMQKTMAEDRESGG